MPPVNPARIKTASGLGFYYLDPCPEAIRLDDIATGLSNHCRFGGQVRHFYSVAQHSVLCALLVLKLGNKYARAALLHDASEAYCCDLPSGLKTALRNQSHPVKSASDYDTIEKPIEEEIRKKFHVSWTADIREAVANADSLAFIIESHTLRGPQITKGVAAYDDKMIARGIRLMRSSGGRRFLGEWPSLKTPPGMMPDKARAAFLCMARDVGISVEDSSPPSMKDAPTAAEVVTAI